MTSRDEHALNTVPSPQDGASYQPPAAEMELFAAKIAHDFNNLLTAVLGNIELLQLRAARNNIRGLESYLDGANSAGARAVAFAARLMSYSGQISNGPSLIKLDDVLGQLAPATRSQLTAGDAGIMCDPGQLALAITELLNNAEAAGGEVMLTSAVADGHAVITVRDTGHGMAPDILARAQEPFFTTAGNGTGRGLGLAIVARVLRDLGGSMDITSQPDAGCIVTLALPLA